MAPRNASRFVAIALAGTSLSTPAADILLTPPSGGGVAVTNAAGNATRFRVADDGSVTLPGVAVVPVPSAALCVEIATSKVGTCSAGSSGVIDVSATAPLASSGGTTPNISLTGVVPVANGGTGASGLPPFGVLYGQGSGAIVGTTGGAGQVLTGTAGAPAFTGSPSLSGNLTLVPSTGSSFGNIFKGATRFVHNTGLENTFAGVEAGSFSVTGQGNTAFGYRGLFQTLIGASNTAIGSHALETNGLGNENTATGYRALTSNTTGGANTAVGDRALFDNAGGSLNTAVGAQALANSTGSSNTALGASAGTSLTTGSFNIAIGNPGAAAESNTTRIGSIGGQTRAFIAGIRGVTTGNANAIPVLIDSLGQLGTVSSSRRVKDDIADMNDSSAGLAKLRPVTFRYRQHGPESRLQYGLIAEEVAEVYPGLVARSADGEIETVMYQYVPVMLLNEYQKQAAEIRELKERMASMARALEALAQERQRH